MFDLFKHVPKNTYVCINGPWAGQTLYLSSGSTLPVVINKIRKGRYVLKADELRWEPSGINVDKQ